MEQQQQQQPRKGSTQLNGSDMGDGSDLEGGNASSSPNRSPRRRKTKEKRVDSPKIDLAGGGKTFKWVRGTFCKFAKA